jgi:hypothetical protein
MTTPNLIFILCSAGARAGKTTMARLLGDYFILSGRGFSGFDTHPYEPEFAERYPNEVGLVNLSSVPGQIALFDGLLADSEGPKIVDLWHHATNPFFSLWDHIGFDVEARRIGLLPVLVFFAEPTERSLALADRVFANHPQSFIITTYNEGGYKPSSVDCDMLARFPGDRIFDMGSMDPILRNIVEAPGFSFARFMRQPPSDMSIVLRAALKAWIARMMNQFRSLELSVVMETAEFLN